MRYAMVVERAENNYSAYVPDLPGCVAAAEIKEELLDLIRGAIDFHLEGCEKLARRSRNRRLWPSTTRPRAISRVAISRIRIRKSDDEGR